MRLVKPGGERRQAPIGRKAFDQLCEVGDRLEYILNRYGRLVLDLKEGRPQSEMTDSLELMKGQLGYVARRLQELLVVQYEQRHAVEVENEAELCTQGALAVAR